MISRLYMYTPATHLHDACSHIHVHPPHMLHVHILYTYTCYTYTPAAHMLHVCTRVTCTPLPTYVLHAYPWHSHLHVTCIHTHFLRPFVWYWGLNSGLHACWARAHHGVMSPATICPLRVLSRMFFFFSWFFFLELGMPLRQMTQVWLTDSNTSLSFPAKWFFNKSYSKRSSQITSLKCIPYDKMSSLRPLSLVLPQPSLLMPFWGSNLSSLNF